MTRPHALICGAGIAGPAAALQLTAAGWRTTVVERAPALREAGQNVDVRGVAREVVRRMGIDGAIREANTTEVGMRFVREDGSVAAAFPVATDGGRDGPTAELEILRGVLSRILYDRTCESTDYRFGRTVVGLDEHRHGIEVTLDDGSGVHADVVVIAEGLRSRTRGLLSDVGVTDFGMYFAYVTVPRDDGDSRWWEWLHLPGSRALHLRPDNLGTTRVVLSFLSDVRGLETLGRDDLVTILRRTFADVGGPAPRVLAALDDAPMYFDAVGARRTPLYARGRVALLGDAAFCNATFGGAGTSLALLGAYVLAGELARTADPVEALRDFARFMEPVATGVPEVGIGVLRRGNPATRGGIRLLHAGARIAASAPARAAMALLGRRMRGILDDVALPDYRGESAAAATDRS